MALVIRVEPVLGIWILYGYWHLDNLRGTRFDAIYVEVLITVVILIWIIALPYQLVVGSDLSLFEDELTRLIL